MKWDTSPNSYNIEYLLSFNSLHRLFIVILHFFCIKPVNISLSLNRRNTYYRVVTKNSIRISKLLLFSI